MGGMVARWRAPVKMNAFLLSLVGIIAATEIASASLVHRWSFNQPAGTAEGGTAISDSISGALAVVVGTGATFTGTELALPGSGAGSNQPANTIPAYVDLPNQLISTKTNLTVELWATPVSVQNNQRLLDFGRVNTAGVGGGAAGEITNASTVTPGTTTSSDTINLNITRGTNLSTQRIEGRLNGGTAVVVDTALSTMAGTQYHFVLTFEHGVGNFPATGGRISWFRDGALVRSIDVNFRLSAIEDVNNWLGRSQFSADYTSAVRYNEVRVYDHAFTPREVAASLGLGVNPSAAPTALADAVMMNHQAKAAIPVLANDTNAVSLQIVQPPQWGLVFADINGRIVYTHTTGASASDSFTYRATNAAGQSASATVTVTFSPNLRLAHPSLNVPQTPPATAYTIVEAFPIAFTDPTCLATPPGENSRFFVCQKGGLLRVIPDTNATAPTASTFLDLPALLATRNERVSTQSEQGLLGLAFHPNYATNGYFYVFYSVDKDAGDGNNALPIYERISRFSVQAGNPNAADPASEVVLIEQFDEAGNHNGGDLHFGPDGYLYISLGDEGDQNDTRNNSQRINKDFFSSILRIDVDKRAGNLEPNANPNPVDYPTTPPPDAVVRSGGVARYSIPIDNPYVHTSLGGTWPGSYNGTAFTAAQRPYVRSEIWASGFRNPWRMSFDGPTGDLWVSDVGGGLREEIDIVTRGGNYGWALREGFTDGPKSAQAPSNFDTLYGTRPIHDYQHGSGPTQGNSITGGFVYRGSRFPSLVGAYIYADYSSGNVWSIRRSGANGATVPIRLTGESGIGAFGKDPANGDILMANLSSDRIRRLVGGLPPAGFPTTLSATGIFAELAELSPNPGVLGYSVNLPFWSDHAQKRRWFTIPSLGPTMTWSADGLWGFPNGQVWVKHFDLELTRGNPATLKRIETRVLVKNSTGAYGVSYRWDDAGADATLVPEEGAAFDLNVTENGMARIQRWQIPGRGDCMTCHTAAAGHALSANTRQMNLSGIMNGTPGNQLTVLRDAGYFGNAVISAHVLPRHLRPDETLFPIEARVRSYLAVNCAYCHREGGTASPAVWDGRPELTLTQTGLIHGLASNNGGDPANQLIVPGDIPRSVVVSRVAVENGFTRMPPLGSNEPDQVNIDLLKSWITSSLPSRQTYAQWRLAKFSSETSFEGGPAYDADFDGTVNFAEFLAATNPTDPGSAFVPRLATSGAEITVSFTLPPNRSAKVETSSDLSRWSLWDIAGNGGLPTQGGEISVTGPALGPQQFFRVRVNEN